MKLKFVHFFNFKTYRGSVTLGPLADLNGIIGGNGSGKSNLIDGIMFALNADNEKLRVSRMDFLIHGSNTRTPLSNNCSVELEFWECGTKTLTLKKKIFYNFNNKTSWPEYEVNGEIVSLDDYKLELSKLHISNGLNNIVVGQGDIGFIIQMSPQQITAYIEEMAGSGEVVQRYKSLEQELEGYDSQIRVLNKSKKGSLNERKILEILQENEAKNTALNAQLEESTRKRVNLETFKLLSDISLKKNQLTLFEKDVDEKNKKIQETEEKIKEYDNKRQELLNNKKVNYNNLLKQKKEFNRNMNLLYEMKDKHKVKNKLFEENLKRQERYITEEKCLKERIAVIDEQILKQQNEQEKARKAYNSIVEDDLQKVTMTEEFKNLDYKYKSRNNFLEFSIKYNESCLEQLNKNKEVNCSMLEKVLYKKSILENGIKAYDSEIKNLEDGKKELENKLNKSKSIQEELSLNVCHISNEVKEIENKIQCIKKDITKKNMLKKIRDKDLKAKDVVEKLKDKFGNNILGRVEDLLKCNETSKSDLFYSYIFEKRNIIVVKDFDSVLNCIDFINENNIGRTDILSIDSLPILRDVIGSSAIYTSNNYRPLKPLVTSNVEEAEQLVDYVCNNILFCDNIDVAISLRKDSRYDECKIVVNDGTIFYRNRIQLNAMSLNVLGEIDNYNEKVIELNKLELQLVFSKDREYEVNMKLNDIESKIKDLEADIKVESNTLNEKLSEKTKLINEFQCLELEESTIIGNISENDKDLSMIQEKLSDLVESRKLLKDEIFRSFLEKYNVKSLDSQDYSSNVQDFLKVIDGIQEKINCLQEEKNSLEISASSQQLLLLEIELDGNRNEITNLAEDIEKLSQFTKELKENITSNESHIEKCNFEFKELDKAIKELKSWLDILKADSTKTIESLKLQIFDFQKKISLIIKKYEYIKLDEHLSIESFDKSYLADIYGVMFEESLDSLLNHAIEIEESIKSEINTLNFLETHKLQCESLKKKFSFLDSELEGVKFKRKACSELFRNVKIERKRKFEELYNLLNTKMEEFMHKLFRSFDCSFYMQCNMVSMEPYLEGTHIYCQLPGKQLRELSQLSTGEKKIVSLSMILACHQITSPPFLIFDEVDANMDHEKLKYLVATLRSLRSDVQFIIVSHIEEVFNQCDAVFGAVDVQNNRVQVTNIFVIDLKEYN
ncbi:Structural maintenance of chromosomes protein 1A [Strongyloides ratti]|uniref:Structural maintenance of chromosomes protein n=1 Tax=Strongyloides ratti TaxID=34506 RepID=A0A090MXL0_STRRB|nr:Structural maintenance of chromosomes protein 1A [Strongyloides ratti]CEF65619.1 Structural maintenance of chromosomes protein 1A [Strongyloides ratti]